MKTPDEIKHALESCAWFGSCDCCGYKCTVPIMTVVEMRSHGVND